MPAVRFTPPPAPLGGCLTLTIKAAEAVLAEWFERPVVLTSSGRAALDLCFQQLGLNRYCSRIAISPRTAKCVFDAVIRSGFPVDPSSEAGAVDAALLIHQYGHVQSARPVGPVVEDICHAFFGAPTTGARDWAGDYAVFSLPKFFGTAGMCGGIAAGSNFLADDLRARRDAAPPISPEDGAQDQNIWRTANGAVVEAIQLRALLHPACLLEALGGLPDCALDLRKVGTRRAAIAHTLLDAIPRAALDDDWRAMCAGKLPFALPIFGPTERLVSLARDFADISVETGVFQIDFRRAMGNPDLCAAVLIPCHDQIAPEYVSAMAAILASWPV